MVSHQLLNRFSFEVTALVQVGLGVVFPVAFFLKKTRLRLERGNQDLLRRIMEASKNVFFRSGISLIPLAVLKYLAMISIPEGSKSLIFRTTVLATGATMVASAVATFFVPHEGE